MNRLTCEPSCLRGLLKTGYVVGALAGFLVLARAVSAGKTGKIDHKVTTSLQSIESPAFRKTMEIVSWPGFPPQSRILPFVYPGLIWLAGYPREAKFQMAAWGTSLISGLVKLIARRPRPDHPEITRGEGNVSGSSFPSGHVLNYVGVYGFLAYLSHLYIAGKWLRRLVVGGLSTLVCLVGPSRIFLGHHWFSDVLASYLLGSSYLVTLTSLYRRTVCRSRPVDPA